MMVVESGFLVMFYDVLFKEVIPIVLKLLKYTWKGQNTRVKFSFSEKATKMWHNHPQGFDVTEGGVLYLVFCPKTTS